MQKSLKVLSESVKNLLSYEANLSQSPILTIFYYQNKNQNEYSEKNNAPCVYAVIYFAYHYIADTTR